MKKLKSLGILLLSLLLTISMSCTALAADDEGTITISNATIGETYHVYKLFDVTVGETYTDSSGDTVTPTAYVATEAQKTALESDPDNVFVFTKLSDGTYQVTVGTTTDADTGLARSYTDDEVIAFISAYVRSVGSLTACVFPGAVEETGSGNDGIENSIATKSTVTINGLPYGYYFVTSSLGSVISIDTTNKTATIVDKNTSTPDWDNNPDEPDPDDPVKDVLDPSTQKSINEQEVEVGDILTYSISYTNNSGELLSEVVVYDVAPDGTEYVSGSIGIKILDKNGSEVKITNGIPTDESAIDENIIYYELDDSKSPMTWTLRNLPDGYTLEATFNVTVLESALKLTDKTIVNDADMEVTLGKNTYWLKTNTVKNPVDDDDEPQKDVKTGSDDASADITGGSIDGNTVSVGDILTYTIEYTNNETDSTSGTGVSVDLTITDAPPTGTTYVAGSAGSTMSDITTITVDKDGNITWLIDDLAYNKTVTVYFQVEVTEAALYLTDSTIPNSASYSFDGTNFYNTNTVKNPVDEPNEPEKDVKAGTSDPSADVTNGSIDGKKVDVGDTLTYTITYTNDQDAAVNLTIKDAPPAGTTYVDGSAGSTDGTVATVDTSGTITWEIKDLAVGDSVTVYFQVTVTSDALTLTGKTVENSADYSFDGQNYYETNTVKNPTDDDEPDEPGDFGKVIINADGTQSTVSTGAFGDTVTFDVSIDAVNLVADEGRIQNDTNTYNDQVAYYYIYDQLVPGFTLTGNFTLTINNVDYAVISTGTSNAGATIYTIGDSTSPVGTMYTYVDADGNSLIGATIYWADAKGNGLYPDCEIHLTYTATINTDAVIAGSGNLNRAIYDYSVVGHNDPYDPDPENPVYPDGSDLNHDTDERTTVTYTYALGVYKVNEAGKALANAQFTLTDAGGNAIYAVATSKDGVYNYTSDSSASDATDTFVSNSSGQIIIKGVDIGTYTLTEVKAPSGYTLLTAPVSITAKMDSSTVTYSESSITTTRYFEAITSAEFDSYTGTVYIKNADGTFSETDKPSAYTSDLYKLVSVASSSSETEITTVTKFEVPVISVQVENKAGVSLPGTGGMGTTLFYIIGGILVFGAAVLLITRKRMSRTE